MCRKDPERLLSGREKDGDGRKKRKKEKALKLKTVERIFFIFFFN